MVASFAKTALCDNLIQIAVSAIPVEAVG